MFSHLKKKKIIFHSVFQNLSFPSLYINSNLRIIDFEMSGWMFQPAETRAGELPPSTPIVCVNPCGSSRRLIQCVRGRGLKETCTSTQTETQGPLLCLRALSGKREECDNAKPNKRGEYKGLFVKFPRHSCLHPFLVCRMLPLAS